jgi:hypothetical protein
MTHTEQKEVIHLVMLGQFYPRSGKNWMVVVVAAAAAAAVVVVVAVVALRSHCPSDELTPESCKIVTIQGTAAVEEQAEKALQKSEVLRMGSRCHQFT